MMELLGILCSIPTAFIASAIYCVTIRRLVRRKPWLTSVLFPMSAIVLIGLVVEWALLVSLGTVRSRGIIGPAFYPAHLVLFFSSAPALANVLVTKKDGTLLGSWFVVALLCSCLALPVVLTQYAVFEALYGIDGMGGPYGVQ